MLSKDKIAIPGSKRSLLHGSKRIQDADPSKRIEVTIIVRRAESSNVEAMVKEIGNKMPRERKHLRREELEKTHGASHEDLRESKKICNKPSVRNN